MFFFFPFAAEPADAFQRSPQYKPLPLLPAPHNARPQVQSAEYSMGNAVSEAGNLAVELKKRALASITSSMTALGNRANALFTQVAATLAFERMARETASFFGMFWPGFAQPRLQPGFAGAWIAPTAEPTLYAPFGVPGFAANPWAGNPWALFADAATKWTSFWMPAAAQRRSSFLAPAPATATIALPGCSWSFAFG